MTSSDQQVYLQKALSAAAEIVRGSSPQDPRTWPALYGPCREHFAILIQHVDDSNANAQVANLMNYLGLYLAKLPDYAQAENLYQRAIKIYENTSGPDHTDVAMCLNNLAALMVENARYKEAEALYWKAFTIRQNAFGPHHTNVGLSLNNLATLMDSTNRQSQAEPLYRRALEIYKSGDEKDSPMVPLILQCSSARRTG
jgi:tetratricopeptide (TPR) repeat protein